MSLFGRANTRHLVRQPLQVALSILGIALGVAVVLAVDLANHSALRAFELSQQAVTGDATHTIVPAGAGIDESFYRALRVEHGVLQSAPRLTGGVSMSDGTALRILGIDPLAAVSVTSREPGAGIDAGTLLGTPNAVVLTGATATRLGVSTGDALRVDAGGRRHALTVAALLSDDDAIAEGLRQTLIVDIATAQVLLDRIGSLSGIDVRLDSDSERRRLEVVLPPSLSLRDSESRSHALAHMTRAFQINLTALSLLALLIGAFLIYNTQTLFVLNRREAFAVWRTLGATRGQVLGRVMVEAAGMALAGCLAGCLIGIGLSHVLLDLVTRSINDLYFSLQTGRVAVDPFSVAKACVLGLAATLAATALPALEAGRVQPRLALSRSRLEWSARRARRAGIGAALAVWTVAAAVLLVSDRSITAGFTGLFCIVAGFAFLAPSGLRLIAGLAAPVLDRGVGWMGLWAARNVLAAMSRTQVAVTALTVALAATIGVSVMIQSFRLTVEHWLDNYLRADIYISRAADNGAGIDPGLPRQLAALPGVETVGTGLWRRLPTDAEPTRVFVLDLDEKGFRNYQLIERTSQEAWQSVSEDGAVLVSESYAYHRRIGTSDSLVLPTAHGERSFTVAGVFYDYGSDRGTVVMHRATYDRYWDDPAFESMAVYVAPGTDGTRVLHRIETEILAGTGLVARSNQRIKQISLAIFDRTFTVTEVLRLLTIVVAVIGILSALVAIQLDRKRELAVLRAGGLTRGELSRVLMLEGGVMGVASAVMSIPLGIVLAAVLVFVINKRSFGWSMQFTIAWEQALLALALGLAAGAVAAVYPAWRMNRQPVTRGLRYE